MVRLGLIGWPLGHSFSPDYFAAKFRREAIEGSYELFPLESFADFDAFIAGHGDLLGFNVTIPYKQAVMTKLSAVDPAADAIGAVNVVKLNAEGLAGYNTDWIGFRDSLLPMLPSAEHTMKALVLGTGGAARAVKYALESLGIECTFVSRHPSASSLTPAINYNEVTPELLRDNKLIVNTTPLGMSPNTDACPEIPYQYLTSAHICFDLVYNPAETEFMKRSSAYGARVKNGLEMLHLQADAAWRIWTET